MIFSDENTPFDMRYASRPSSAASSSFQPVWQPGHGDPPEDSGDEKLDNLLFLIASGSKNVVVTPGAAHAAEGSATCNNASDRPTQPLEERPSPRTRSLGLHSASPDVQRPLLADPRRLQSAPALPFTSHTSPSSQMHPPVAVALPERPHSVPAGERLSRGDAKGGNIFMLFAANQLDLLGSPIETIKYTSGGRSSHQSQSSSEVDLRRRREDAAVTTASITSGRLEGEVDPEEDVLSSDSTESIDSEPPMRIQRVQTPHRPASSSAEPSQPTYMHVEPRRPTSFSRPPTSAVGRTTYDTFEPELPAYSVPLSNGGGGSGTRTTSLTMQIAQHPDGWMEGGEDDEEDIESDGGLEQDDGGARDAEQREFLTQPLGLLALSQALGAALDEVNSLRSMVRDVTGLVEVQSSSGGPLAMHPLRNDSSGDNRARGPLQPEEIDDLSGPQARALLKMHSFSPSPPPHVASSLALVKRLHLLLNPEATDEAMFSEVGIARLGETLEALVLRG